MQWDHIQFGWYDTQPVDAPPSYLLPTPQTPESMFAFPQSPPVLGPDQQVMSLIEPRISIIDAHFQDDPSINGATGVDYLVDVGVGVNPCALEDHQVPVGVCAIRSFASRFVLLISILSLISSRQGGKGRTQKNDAN